MSNFAKIAIFDENGTPTPEGFRFEPEKIADSNHAQPLSPDGTPTEEGLGKIAKIAKIPIANNSQ